MVDDVTAEAELPLEGAGSRLMRAREAAGLSRAQIAATTKIPERHLVSIETGNFAALPASTYAIGFSRSYARAVSLDPNEIASAVRAELGAVEPEAPRRATPSFEPGDPARVPSAKFAWLAALAAVVLLLAGFSWWHGYFSPGGELPSILPDEAPAASTAPAATPSAASGPVVFTALAPAVWVKFSDGTGAQLFQKELAQGESYTVPADAADVRLMTARPNQLAITIGGQPVAKISDVEAVVRNVPVTAAALQARGTDAAVASEAPTATAAPAARNAPTVRNQRRQAVPSAIVRDRGPTATAHDHVLTPPTDAIPALTPAAEPAPAEKQTADR